MSGEKWTEGPWKVGNAGFDVETLFETIATTDVGDEATSTEKALANAHLIASAPDLAKAVKMLMEGCEPPGEAGSGKVWSVVKMPSSEALTFAANTLARARGEQESE